MCKLYKILPKIICNKPNSIITQDYTITREDNKNGFLIKILKNNNVIIEVDYDKINGGKLINISASREEVSETIEVFDSCLLLKTNTI